MKAVVLRALGGPANLVLEELPDPKPARNEVLLRVRACGVCYHDVIARRGDLGPVPLPAVLGHEVVPSRPSRRVPHRARRRETRHRTSN